MPNFATQIFHANQHRTNKTAVIDGTRSLTYGELESHSRRVAAHLLSLGLRPQDRAIFCLDDCVEWEIAFLAALLIGVNPVCINHNNSKEQLRSLIDLTDAAAVIIDTIPDIDSDPVWLTKADIMTAIGQDPVIPYDYHDDEGCYWLVTSGTTGHPKAIVHRHKNLENYYALTKDVFCVSESSNIFATAKLSFGYGLSTSIVTALPAGATVFVMPGVPAPSRVFDAINEYDITHFYTVPTVINSMLKHNKNHAMPSLRYVYSAGESLPPVISKDFQNTFNILARNTIGMSEVASMYCIQDFENYEHGTLGQPFPGVECKLVDENGHEVAEGQEGELYVKSYCKASHYWKDWQYTNYTFVGEWIRSGDKMRKTQLGNYVYVSRTSDQVKINGHFVSASEIESVLFEIPVVYDCAVVFLETEKFPEIHAFLRLADDAQLDVKEIKTILGTKLPYFKIPEKFHLVQSIPKTLTNKTKRHVLKQDLLAQK